MGQSNSNQSNSIQRTFTKCEYTEAILYLTDKHIQLYDVERNKLHKVAHEIKSIGSMSVHSMSFASYADQYVFVIMSGGELTRSYRMIYYDKRFVKILERNALVSCRESRDDVIYAEEWLAKQLKTLNFNHWTLKKPVDICGATFAKSYGILDYRDVKDNVINVCHDKYECNGNHDCPLYQSKIKDYNYITLGKSFCDECKLKGEKNVERVFCLRDFHYYGIAVYRLEITRQYILLSEFCSGHYYVHVYDKKTFEKIYMGEGMYCTVYNDYDDWFKVCLDYLKGVRAIGELAEDLLKLILVYCS
jgi:hypothetical protein